MRKRWRNGLFSLAILLCLAGCGAEDDDQAAGQEAAGMRTAVAGAEGLYINDCILLQFEAQEMEYQEKTLLYDTCGSKLYMLWAYPGKEGAMEHSFLYILDGDTKEMEQQPFELRLPDRETGYIKSMDVQNGDQLSFRLSDSEGDFLVITDLEGNVIRSQEAFPDPEAYPWNVDTQQRYTDRAFDMGDGSVILVRRRDSGDATELFLYDTESGEKAPMTVFDGELVQSLCMDGAGAMYYTTLESLGRWDRESNTRTRLLDLHANGISAAPASGNLLVNKLLEVCRQYGCENYGARSRQEQAKQMKAGDGIGEVMCFVDGILAFSSWMNQYEGSGHIVGFPTREGSKNYIMADNTYLVVSAQAEHLEEIKELIAYLLGYENQFEHSYMSVRGDVIRDSVQYDGSKYVLRVSANGDTRMELDVKPDGTTYLEEYLAFIGTCEPEPGGAIRRSA